MKKPPNLRHSLPLLLLAFTSFAILLFFLHPAGLSVEGKKVLAVLVAAIILWIAEVMPVALTSLLILVLLAAVNIGGRQVNVFAGFSSSILYFLVGVLVIGRAVLVSGLAQRIANIVIVQGRQHPQRMFWLLLLYLPVLPLIAPSALTRNTILIPVYEDVFNRLNIPKRANFTKSIMLVLGIINPLASSTFITGGLAPMTSATLLGGFNWFKWFAFMSLPYYFIMFLGGIFIYLVNLRGVNKPGKVMEIKLEELSNKRWVLNTQEKRVIGVLIVVLILWLTDFIHHLNPAIPALLGALLLLLPGFGVISWSDFEKGSTWSTFFVLGATLSLAEALKDTGTTDWLARNLISSVSHVQNPLLFLVFLILIIALVHLVIPNIPACIAFLIPVVKTFALGIGINPVLSCLIVSIVVDAVVFYPVQTATNLLAYDTGYFHALDIFLLGIFLLLATMAVIIFIAVPYWGLLGQGLLVR